MFVRTLVLAIGLSLLTPVVSQAFEPQWELSPVAFGARRQQIRSSHILDRPYRPFHVYGNTVRRRYYRGSAMPRPRDMAGVGAALLRVNRR
jgi:hypothetical protein